MGDSFFAELFQEDFLKLYQDAPTTVTIDITVDGETEAISVRLDDLASLLQPALRASLQPLARYRRVPKTVLPKVSLLEPSRFLTSASALPLHRLLRRVSENPRTELLPLVDVLPQSQMEQLAVVISDFGRRSGALTEIMAVALENEFEKCRSERGSIMRGSSFAVQMAKLFVAGPEMSEYRCKVLSSVMQAIASAGSNQPDLSVTFQTVLDAICCDEAVVAMPSELRHVCFALADLSEKLGLSPDERDGQVAGLIMLRFFNPAIISPSSNGLLLDLDEGAGTTSVMTRLKDLTRVLQKFSTGQSYTDDNSMAAVQSIMNDRYAAFRSYLKRICVAMEPLPLCDVSLDMAMCCDFFRVLCAVPDSLKSFQANEWVEIAGLMGEYRYVHKLQLFLQSETSYLSQLEKIEEQLHKIVAVAISTGDPFESFYEAIRRISAWHASLFLLLHDRVEREWQLLPSAAEWIHLMLLEIEQVYNPYTSGFLFVYRTLIDIGRDVALGSEVTPEVMDVHKTISSLLPIIGRPLKRFGDILSILSDAQPSPNHPDAAVIAICMKRGKEVFNLMREEVNVSTVLEMGQIELQFDEKLDLIKAGRTIIRHGFLMDDKGNQLEMWLFSDMLLCGVPQAGPEKRYRVLCNSPLSRVSTRPVPGEENSFLLLIHNDDDVSRPSPREPLTPSGGGTTVGLGGLGASSTGLGTVGVSTSLLTRDSGVGGGSSASTPKTLRNRRASSTVRVAAGMVEQKLTCSSVKQKTAWLEDILGRQETLSANVRLGRSSVAKEQIPSLSAPEWGELVKRCGRGGQMVQAGESLLTEGSRNLHVWRVARGRLKVKRGDLELLKLAPGDFFGMGSLLARAQGEVCLFDVVSLEASEVESVSTALLDSVQDVGPMLSRLYKNAVSSTENLLRKVRLRYAARQVLVRKQRKQLDSTEVAGIVLRALDEAESSVSGGAVPCYSKLDIVDLILGRQPADFSTPAITEVWPHMLEMKSFRSAAGAMFTRRAEWVAVLTALENDKMVALSKEGAPILTKKGRGALPSGYGGLDLAAIAASCDDFFGLRGESVLAQFMVTTNKHMDRLYISEHFFCLTGGRVLGLGAEKKQVVNLGHVVVCEQRKKQIDLVFAISLQLPPLKITFKTLAEAATARNLIHGKQRVLNEQTAKLYQGFPQVTFSKGTVIPAPETPSVYVLGDVGTVRVVAKMAAGDMVLRELEPGASFVTDAAFFGMADDSKQVWMSDVNVDTVAVRVPGSAMAQSQELSNSVLLGLLQTQMLEMESHAQGL